MIFRLCGADTSITVSTVENDSTVIADAESAILYTSREYIRPCNSLVKYAARSSPWPGISEHATRVDFVASTARAFGLERHSVGVVKRKEQEKCPPKYYPSVKWSNQRVSTGEERADLESFNSTQSYTNYARSSDLRWPYRYTLLAPAEK